MAKTPQFSEYDWSQMFAHSTIEMSSPFRNAVIAINWCNKDYPVFHDHDHWELTILLSGEIMHTINEEEYMMKRGDACLIRPEDRHRLKFKKGYHGEYQHVNFVFREEFARQIFSVYDSYEKLLTRKNSLHFTLDDTDLITLYDKTLLTQNLPQDKYEASTKLIVSRILVSFLEQDLLFDTNYPDWFNIFLNELSNPNNFDKSVKELVADTSYSYSRLARLFKQYTGQTMVDYVNEKKMFYTKRLLRATNLTTLQIAEKIGFSSLSSFNHLFKGTYGLTPSEYRKQHSRENN